MMTHRFPLRDVAEAFATVQSPASGAVKVIVEIAKPRLEALAKRAGERAKVTPSLSQTRRSATFDFKSPKALMTLTFSVAPDQQVKNAVVEYDLKGADGAKAYWAVLRLAASGKESTPFLKERFKGEPEHVIRDRLGVAPGRVQDGDPARGRLGQVDVDRRPAQAGDEREQSEDQMRHRPPARREPRLDELDLMEAAIDVAGGQAEERDRHQHVTADLVRDFQREIEQRARDDVDGDQDEHHDERNLARDLAGPFDRAFRQRARAARAGGLRVTGMLRRAHRPRARRQRLSAARTLVNASTASGPRVFAHSSQ